MMLFNTPDRWQSNTLILWTNVDQKSLETVFSIAICRQSGDKWQSKTLFLVIFSSVLVDCYIRALCGVFKSMHAETSADKPTHLRSGYGIGCE